MSIAAYKLMHLLGVFFLLAALVGMATHAATGVSKEENPNHRSLLVLHGLGALLALVGGFGLLAKMGLMADGGFPGWVSGKLVVWAVLGGLTVLPYRKPGSAPALIFLVPFLGLAAAALAILKPF